MTTTRSLPAVVVLVLGTAGTAWGQFRMPPYATPGRGVGAGMADEAPPPRPAPTDRLERMTAPPGQGAGQPNPLGTLTGQPGPTGLPPGAYGTPGYTDAAGCCGPVGANGLVVYELYSRTGPSLVFGSGPFTDRLHAGWSVAGGGRTLFFNPEGDAAWAVDLGLSYTYNRGSNDDLLDLFIRQAPQTGANNQIIPRADQFLTTRIRGLHRTSFNYAIGRDWFLWGNGLPGAEDGWNFRVGTDLGGQWGTAHVDLVPQDGGANSYSRRQKVYEGVFLGFHSNFEVPMNGWIWTFGTRVEYGYQWMNIVPPVNGNVQYVNLLLTTGIRF